MFDVNLGVKKIYGSVICQTAPNFYKLSASLYIFYDQYFLSNMKILCMLNENPRNVWMRLKVCEIKRKIPIQFEEKNIKNTFGIPDYEKLSCIAQRMRYCRYYYSMLETFLFIIFIHARNSFQCEKCKTYLLYRLFCDYND